MGAMGLGDRIAVVAFGACMVLSCYVATQLPSRAQLSPGPNNGIVFNSSGALSGDSRFIWTNQTGNAGSYLKLWDNGITGFDAVSSGSLNLQDNNHLTVAFGTAGSNPRSVGPYAYIHAQGFSGYGFLDGGTTMGFNHPLISGCGAGTLVGGNSVGSFVSGTTGVCTVTITPEDSSHIINGWSCDAADVTHPTLMNLTGSTATTFSLSGTTTTGDVIIWKCMGY
jgi:hypothetical protein